KEVHSVLSRVLERELMLREVITEVNGNSTAELEAIDFVFRISDSPGSVNFVLSKEGSSDVSLVDEANVWLFLRLAKTNRSRAKVSIRLFQQRDNEQNDVLLAEKNVDTRRSGWHTFSVSSAVSVLLKSDGESTLNLRVSLPSLP
ncbi:hypothetical protein KUCAC02_037956, partial [Chaenocephalus aceratus]